MGMKFSNNASTTLQLILSSSATTLTVASGTGGLFPSVSGSNYFYATLTNASNAIEIVKVTNTSGDVFTIVRGQDGTSANSWNSGDKLELRVVAANLNDLPKLDEANTFSGNNTFSGTNTFSASNTFSAVQNMSVGSVGGPWTTAGRPTSPATGQSGYNSTLGKVETWNGSAWVSSGGATGGGGDDVFYENSLVVTSNYTLSTNKNAHSVGPITIQSGKSVTIPSGQRWVVL